MENTIFNLEKSDYKSTPLFLGDKPGLFDTVNKQYPEIWDLYKKMKSLDWDENEFNFSSCNQEFKTCSKTVYDIMIKTIAWQWETDSIAGRQLVPIIAPFVSSSELWAAYQAVGYNEIVHAATYSEIVRNSFDNPDEVLSEILSIKEAVSRLNIVSEVMETTRQVSHKLGLKLIDPNSDEAYEAVFMFVVAMLTLERIQFMQSFKITFAIADTGQFLPVGKAVQKICQDEYEIHVKLGKTVLKHELATERGQRMFNNCKDKIIKLITEVYNSEIEWTEYAFSEGRELPGVTKELIQESARFDAADVFLFFGINPPFKYPYRNPCGFMDNWMNISSIQAAPQEEKIGQYMLGMVVDNIGSDVIEVDF